MTRVTTTYPYGRVQRKLKLDLKTAFRILFLIGRTENPLQKGPEGLSHTLIPKTYFPSTKYLHHSEGPYRLTKLFVTFFALQIFKSKNETNSTS